MIENAVARVAQSHDDIVVRFAAGSDGVYPQSYDALVADVRASIGQIRDH